MVKISSSKQTLLKRYVVTVIDSGWSLGAVAGIVFVVLSVFAAAAAAAGFLFYRWKKVEEKEVTSTEGDTVTLHTSLTELQTGDEIQWWYGDSLIAEITGGKEQTYDVADEGFSGKLTLDKKTGDLKILKIKTTLSGLYKLKITRNRVTTPICTHKRFILSVNLNVVQTNMGDSLTLSVPPGTNLQKDDLILWKFGPTGSAIATFDRALNKITTYDVSVERFRDGLNLDEETGSLTIKNIKPEHAGIYKVQLSNGKGTRNGKYRVIVTVKIVQASIGQSVTLKNHTKIQTGDQLTWRFEDEKSAIAEIKGGTDPITYKDKLQLDKTGSLTITDIRKEVAGLYELKIISISTKTTNKTFCVYTEAKEVSVKEGETARLETDVENVQSMAIRWMCENIILIVKLAGTKVFTYDHVLDERFKDRLELDKKTGDLSIKNTNTGDSGQYSFWFNRSGKDTFVMFIVSVSGSAGEVTGNKPKALKEGSAGEVTGNKLKALKEYSTENGASESVTVVMQLLSGEQQSSL